MNKNISLVQYDCHGNLYTVKNYGYNGEFSLSLRMNADSVSNTDYWVELMNGKHVLQSVLPRTSVNTIDGSYVSLEELPVIPIKFDNGYDFITCPFIVITNSDSLSPSAYRSIVSMKLHYRVDRNLEPIVAAYVDNYLAKTSTS